MTVFPLRFCAVFTFSVRARRLRLLVKSIHKFLGIELTQVVDSLADSDVTHRNSELVGNTEDDASLCGPI